MLYTVYNLGDIGLIGLTIASMFIAYVLLKD